MAFNLRYPPLVWLIKIELCNAFSGLGTGSDEIVLATEYMNLRELGNYRSDDQTFLPTFGPQHVDLYSKPNNLRIEKTYIDTDSEVYNNIPRKMMSYLISLIHDFRMKSIRVYIGQ